MRLHSLRPLVLLCLASGPLAAQKNVDPDTQDDPARIAAAGYSRVGAMEWADGHDTENIRAVMTGRPLCVVETEHFRVASALGARPLPANSVDREAIRAELRALATRLPGVDPKSRELDPWLLTHLYAHRCETLYAELAQRFGVTAADFPAAGAPRKPEHLGRGPHMGRRERHLLLMFETEGDLARYLQTYTDRTETRPVRHYFERSDCLGYVVCADAHRGVLRDEEHMHANVTFSVVLNLVDAFGDYDPDAFPLWLREGIAHWYRRRVHPEHNNFSHFDDDRADEFTEWQWGRKVRARVAFGVAPSFRRVRKWHDPAGLTLVEHAMMWSRVDHLFSLEAEGFGRFWRNVQANYYAGPRWEDEDRTAWHDAAFEAGWGLDAQEVDEGWKKFVVETYPAAKSPVP